MYIYVGKNNFLFDFVVCKVLLEGNDFYKEYSLPALEFHLELEFDRFRKKNVN